jgi:hypothetical protein
VHADINNIEPIEKIEDKDLNRYLLKDDSRQLLHISYGFILADKALKNRLFKALNSHRKSYEDRLRKHIGKHISLLKNP